jgi:hypothetical protein
LAVDWVGHEHAPGPGQQRPPQMPLEHWSLALQTWPVLCLAAHEPALLQ